MPWPFAWYIARSAWLSSVSAESPGFDSAMPIVVVTETESPATSIRLRSASRMRSQEAPTSSGSCTSSSSTANSSPPSRATVSVSRTVALIRCADLDEQLVAGRVAEQVVDPLEAVEVAEQHGQLAAAAGLHRHRVLDPVHEQRPVRQAGERVVPGQVGHVLAQAESGEGVLGHGDQSGQALPVVLGGRASAVEAGPDDPDLLAAAVHGDADLGARRWVGCGAGPAGRAAGRWHPRVSASITADAVA